VKAESLKISDEEHRKPLGSASEETRAKDVHAEAAKTRSREKDLVGHWRAQAKSKDAPAVGVNAKHENQPARSANGTTDKNVHVEVAKPLPEKETPPVSSDKKMTDKEAAEVRPREKEPLGNAHEATKNDKVDDVSAEATREDVEEQDTAKNKHSAGADDNAKAKPGVVDPKAGATNAEAASVNDDETLAGRANETRKADQLDGDAASVNDEQEPAGSLNETTKEKRNAGVDANATTDRRVEGTRAEPGEKSPSETRRQVVEQAAAVSSGSTDF
jgi:hypothetical protein